MRHGSLFSGIGGFDLASQWMGWANVFQCEIDPFCQKVLKYHFLKVDLYGDIKKTDFSKYRGTVDIITGGFPCQPFSQAGKRKGTEDDRYLWPEMLRVIKEVQPGWIVGENVYGIVNWNGGLVFEQVCSDLEAEGYEVQPYILPAVSVNAPHRRDRVWFVAHCKSERWTRRGDAKHNRDYEKRCLEQGESNNWKKVWRKSQGYGEPTSDTKSTRGERQFEQGQKQVQSDRRSGETIPPNWKNFPTKPPVCGGNDGIPRKLDSITFPKWRNESIKSYGNAIVPQVALQIFKAIEKYELQ